MEHQGCTCLTCQALRGMGRDPNCACTGCLRLRDEIERIKSAAFVAYNLAAIGFKSRVDRGEKLSAEEEAFGRNLRKRSEDDFRQQIEQLARRVRSEMEVMEAEVIRKGAQMYGHMNN